MGRKIGNYRIRSVIGAGGMGTVYLAVQESPRRSVALKVMKQGITSRSALRRFEFEAQLLGRLRHPGIAQIHEAGKHDDGEGSVPYFAMEYVPSARSLIDYARDKGLSTRERLELFAYVCDAVGHGHQKGIIHRDLKPSNILVDSAGHPKIIDFGVARATDSDMAVTTLQTDLRQIIGTLQYMSPEQCGHDALDLDTSSDVYALGVVMYELLCDQLPYDLSDTPVPRALIIIQEAEPVRLSSLNRTLCGDVETICLKALEKDRSRRYRTAADVGDDIRRYLGDEPITARPPGVTDTMRRFARKHTAAALGIVGALLTVAVVVFMSMYGYTRAVLVEAERANEQTALQALQQWDAETRDVPPRWEDEAEQLAKRSLALHKQGRTAMEAGGYGDAAESLVEAVGLWRQAVRRQANAIPRLIATGVEAVRAGRREEAEMALIRARGAGASEDDVTSLVAELSLHDLVMVEIPADTIEIGARGFRAARPVHTVRFARPFEVSATEITQGQFYAIMRRNPSRFAGDLRRPVEQVSWFDTIEFCNELSRRRNLRPCYEIEVERRNDAGSIQAARVTRTRAHGYRLPSEAEWEYACRAGTATAFSFGDFALHEGMWFTSNSDGTTHPVGMKKPNAFGLYDMHGNVQEWCEDPYHPSYERAPTDGSAWTHGKDADATRRALRGGAWGGDPKYCQSAYRYWYGAGYGLPYYGFRVARDVR